MTLGSDCELKVRKAAKEHECWLHMNPFRGPDQEPSSGCTGKIKPGELYIENMDSAPAYSSGTRYCVPCAEQEFGVDPALVAAER